MKALLLTAIIIGGTIISGDTATAQTSQISVADETAPGWKDHRNHTLLLRNNAANALIAVMAVKSYKRVPNTPSFVSAGAQVYMIVGGDALLHETRTERIVVPAHGEKKVTYECFGVSLIGEEPVKTKPKRRS
jgi:hypothetical protein